MRVIVVPCLTDNYAYLVTADDRTAFVVDPSEAAPVEAALRAHGLSLTAILNTHHHHDHVGGNEALATGVPALDVVAHESDQGRVPRQTRGVAHEETFHAAGLDVTALHIPGHTMGAVAYLVNGAVFTGDTLFVAGCGRLFEGTPGDMDRSLNQTLGALPDETRVYCGHEYTLGNLAFAATVEPDNPEIRAAIANAEERRSRGEPTVPSTLAHERRTNPFMRVHLPPFRARFGSDTARALGAVRQQKDEFRVQSPPTKR